MCARDPAMLWGLKLQALFRVDIRGGSKLADPLVGIDTIASGPSWLKASATCQLHSPLVADPEHNKAVVRMFMDEVSDGGKVELLEQLCAEGVVNHAARAGLQNGIESFKTLMLSIHESQTDRHWTEQRYLAEGDLVIVYGVREGDWRAPSFRGVTTPAGHIATELAHMFRLEDGLITEHWAVRDDLGMMQQLGVLPSPER